MLLTFVAASLIAPVGMAQNPMLSKIIANPTGQNGYEEYVQAAMFLSLKDHRPLDNYVAWLEYPTGPERPRPAEIPEQATLLDGYRIQVDSESKALDLIRAGNLKPVWYPNKPITAMTVFPELSYMKTAERLFTRLAYVKFASGDTNSGTRALLDGLTLAKHIQVGGMLHLRIGYAFEQIMFASCRKHLGQLSLKDAEAVQNWASGQGNALTEIRQAAECERSQIRDSFEQFCRQPDGDLEGLVEDAAKRIRIAAALKATTSQWRQKAYELYFKRLEAPMNALIDRLAKPEDEWLAPLQIEPYNETEFDSQSAEKLNLDSEAAVGMLLYMKLYSQLTEGDDESLSLQQVERYLMQERILGLYAGVVRYRWINGKLPTSLAQVCGKEPIDPATNKPYTYVQEDQGKFRIFCQTPELGTVDLVMKVPQPSDSEPPPPAFVRPL